MILGTYEKLLTNFYLHGLFRVSGNTTASITAIKPMTMINAHIVISLIVLISATGNRPWNESNFQKEIYKYRGQ